MQRWNSAQVRHWNGRSNIATWWSLFSILRLTISPLDAHICFNHNSEPDHPFTESATYLNHAVDGLRQAGRSRSFASRFACTRGVYRVTGAFDKAQKDLDEAFSIATRGGMGLYLADCHLEYARLALARPHPNPPLQGEGDEARKHWEIAKDMIDKMGYHRRDKEVEEIEKQL